MSFSSSRSLIQRIYSKKLCASKIQNFSYRTTFSSHFLNVKFDLMPSYLSESLVLIYHMYFSLNKPTSSCLKKLKKKPLISPKISKLRPQRLTIRYIMVYQEALWTLDTEKMLRLFFRTNFASFERVFVSAKFWSGTQS